MRSLLRSHPLTGIVLLWLRCLALVVASAAAWAQTAPQPAPAASAPEPPSYVPGAYGDGLLLGADWQRGLHGWHAFWFFARDGAVATRALWCLHSSPICAWAPPVVSAAVQSCKQQASAADCVRALWRERVRLSCAEVPRTADGEYVAEATGELADICRESRALRKAYAVANGIPWPPAAASAPQAPPDAPSAPTHVVGMATRADGTRPAYAYVDGVRSTKAEPAGALSGQPCDASKAFETTRSGVWAPFGPAFAPNVGTLCVPAN